MRRLPQVPDHIFASQAIFYYLLGYRIQVMALMAREVLVPRGLVGMGLDMMDQSHQEIFTV